MNKKPLVSIVIPVYNGSNYMREAIDSAINQTYDNIEIIVVNDGSRDDGATEKIALTYGDKIRYIRKENGGVSSALNLGIANMRGEYFSWLSHDDFYMPEKIEKEVLALNQHQSEGNDLVYCDVELVNKDSKHISYLKNKRGLKEYEPWHEALNSMLLMGSYNGCALLVPKKAFDLVGGFDTELRFCQDAKMWAEIFLEKFNLIYVNEVLCANRIHGGQLTQRGREIFHSDSEKISTVLAPKIAKSEHAGRLMFSYAYHNATLDNTAVVKRCISELKGKKLLSPIKRIRIAFASAYGKIRPTIRKIYYRIFRGIRTK